MPCMKTLILNANYRPLSIIDMRRAVVLDTKPNITALCYYEQGIMSMNGEIKIPAVMVYSKYIHVVRKKSPSKRAIRMRDKSRCAYCDLFLEGTDFTIDHVIPVSRFKTRYQSNTWENLVSCCKGCNLKKGNRTPEEASMTLLIKPKQVEVMFIMEEIPQEWSNYM